MPITADQLWKLVKDKVEGGGTYDIAKGSLNTTDLTGFCVAYLATQNLRGRAGLDIAYNHALANHQYVGYWVDNERKPIQIYFDSVRIFQKRASAQEAAIAQQQLAIFDIGKGELIQLGDKKGAGVSFLRGMVTGAFK